tara:strand:+ start:195 stop:557 length:363 start_codon:yes stop_codon:yes gene_type:complete
MELSAGKIAFSIFVVWLILILIIGNVYQYSVSGSRLGLDQLYRDFKGNDPSSVGRMNATIDISSKEGSCKFNLIYKGDSKEVTSMGDGKRDDPEYCSYYEYKKGIKEGDFIDRLIEKDME